MSATSITGEGTAERAELSPEEGSQAGRQDRWWSKTDEADIELDKYSYFGEFIAWLVNEHPTEFNFERSESKPQLDLDKYCIVWPAPAKSQGTHHASFGDNGTTASVSRYGDMMQVTQCLEKGHSGLFSMDHTETRHPSLVSQRARDIDHLSETARGNYSYGLFMTDWPTTDPSSIKWLNWRWPRYEWKTGNLTTIFQYYVHEGVVLHQLLFHNASDKAIDLKHDPSLSGEMRVRDLDYLYCNDQDEQRTQVAGSPQQEHTGPRGYGRVQCHPNCQVVAVIDVFIDGRRKEIPEGRDLETLEPLGVGCTREIVIAYRLSLIPYQPAVTWQDFMIPAAKANVGKLLRDEIEKMGSRCLDPELLDLPLVGRTIQNTLVADARDYGSKRAEDAVQTDAVQTDAVQTDSREHDGGSGQRGFEKTGIQQRVVRYLTARHLEHILSVCAVPVPCSHNEPTHPSPHPVPVALTCGDMSGHRICTSATYYAFLFLIKSDRRLAEVRDSPSMEDDNIAHIDFLRKRIRKTCEGHIMWLENVWKITNPEPFTSGYFEANYWVTGQTQDQLEGDNCQPPNCVTDTAFQILKITEYASAYEIESGRSVQSLLTKIFVAWLQDLDRLDHREKFAWQRPKQDGADTFRLEDHFWVWRALKALEEQNMWSDLPKPKRSTPNAGKRDINEENAKWDQLEHRVGWCLPRTRLENLFRLYGRFFLITRRLVPHEVRRGVLQRFTTVNDVSGVRALAVSRSSRETQFLLHDRDSAMLYDHDGPKYFFQDKSSEWEQTLKSQPCHPANEESDPGSKWYTTMRYALSIMMGARGKTLNSMSASSALSGSFDTLLNFFGHSGFLGEQLSWLTKGPVIFDEDRDQDSYFHASFEVVYVLLTHGSCVQPILEDKRDQKKSVAESYQLADILAKIEGMSSAIKALPEGLATLQRQRVPMTMEEKMPFNNHAVSSNVIPINEEWLYNYPEFFSAARSGPSVFSQDDKNSTSHDGISSGNEKGMDTMILDAKKHKQYGKPRKRNTDSRKDFRISVLTYEALKGRLGTPRITADAKKRFIWLANTNLVTLRKLCFAARDSEAEKEALVLFFNRHLQREKHVQDETSLALNAWCSEVHLSFQCLADQYQPTAQHRNRQFPQSQGKEGKMLCRASIGYRFNGDLFDHYWTCHLIESSYPQQSEHSAVSSQPPDTSSLLSLTPPSLIPSSYSPSASQHNTCCTCPSPVGESPKCEPCIFLAKDDRKDLLDVLHQDKQGFKTWWQRRVLEILLLQRMLFKVWKSTETILKTLGDSLLDEEQENILLQSESQRTSNSWLGLVDDTLGTIQDDLKSTLEILRNWDERAKIHGVAKPRWTLNDENKYRRSIQKQQASLNRRRNDIEKQKQRVESLQKSVKEKLKAKSEKEEKRRAAREQQSERNIRWFTYVTIVFAPLSFAEGFYSMGGAPSYELTRSLSTFSVVALFITVLSLFGAINTFSALEKKRDLQESGSASQEDDSNRPGRDGKRFHSLWSLFLNTVLDHLVGAMLYPMRIRALWEGGTIPTKALPFLVLGLALSITILPVVIILWLIKLSLLYFLKFCIWLRKELYVPPPKRSKPPKDEESGTSNEENAAKSRKTGVQ